MNTLPFFSLRLLCLLLSIVAFGSPCSGASAPTVTTQAATNVRAATATLNGTVNANGAPTTARFEYSTDPNFLNAVVATPDLSLGNAETPVAITASITGVSPGVVYYARLVAQNSSGGSTAARVSFTTNTPPTGGLIYVIGRNPPGSLVRAGAFNWKDSNQPLSYQFVFNGASLGPPSTSPEVTFTAPDAVGKYGFTVRVFDSLGDFTERIVSLIVNNPPIVRPAKLEVSGREPVEISVAKLLTYASDPDGDTVTIDDVSFPSLQRGGVFFRSDGIILYTPPANYTGPDQSLTRCEMLTTPPR